MSGFDKKETGEGFEEVLISQSTDEEDQTVTVTATEQIAPVEAVNISKYEDDDEEEGATSSMDNIVPVSQVSNGWNVMSGWIKMGAEQAGPLWEKAKQVTVDTVEATAPARSQFYDLSVKVAADVGPATKVVTDVAGSTFHVVGDALVSTSEIVSTSLNNAAQELSEFATEMQNGPPVNSEASSTPPTPKNTSV